MVTCPPHIFLYFPQLECCWAAYAGQVCCDGAVHWSSIGYEVSSLTYTSFVLSFSLLKMSGACLSQLKSPPTTSPTNTGNAGSLFYPDYSTAWPDAGCINVLPVPSGRPTYTSRLACCKGAYGGQVSHSLVPATFSLSII